MLLKKANKDDLPEILAVQKLAFYSVAAYYNNFRLRPLLSATLDDLENSFDKYIYLKAVENNSIVGSVRAFKENKVCKIENMIVHPDFQNKGIGKMLMSEIEGTFSECTEYELFTGKSTPKNVPFYIKLGFEITGERSPTETEPTLVILKKILSKTKTIDGIPY